jgi:hypothetical protein
MNFTSRAGQGLLLIALVVTLTGCPGGSQWVDDATRGLTNARRSVQSADDLAHGGRAVLDDSTRTLDDLVQNAPDNLNSEQSRIITQITQTKLAIAQARLAIVTADNAAAALPQDAADVAAAATSQADAQITLTDVTRTVLQDVACDIAIDHLSREEKDELEADGQRRLVPDVVEPTAESVMNYADRELARLVGGRYLHQFVAWRQYANSFLEKRDQYIAGVQGVIESPTWTVTRAYYYYARLCLKPPR